MFTLEFVSYQRRCSTAVHRSFASSSFLRYAVTEVTESNLEAKLQLLSFDCSGYRRNEGTQIISTALLWQRPAVEKIRSRLGANPRVQYREVQA
jgi:hypothetical protein